MISEEFRRTLRSEPQRLDVDGACLWQSVIRKVGERLPNIGPNFTADQWTEQWKFGTEQRPFLDNDTPAYTRAIQSHCTRTLRTEFIKNTIEIPHGWTSVTYQSSSQQYLNKILLDGLKEQAGKKADKHVILRQRIASKAKHNLIRTVGNHRSFLTFITSGTPTQQMN